MAQRQPEASLHAPSQALLDGYPDEESPRGAFRVRAWCVIQGQPHHPLHGAQSRRRHLALQPAVIYSFFPSSRNNQVFAIFQSRRTVSGDTFKTSEHSSIVNPPKYRSSTTWPFRGSIFASKVSRMAKIFVRQEARDWRNPVVSRINRLALRIEPVTKRHGIAIRRLESSNHGMDL